MIMVVDCRKYFNNLEQSQHAISLIWNRYPDKNRAVTEFSVSANIPIVVTCLYFNRVFGEAPEVTHLKNECVIFYKYTKIIHFDGTEQIIP